VSKSLPSVEYPGPTISQTPTVSVLTCFCMSPYDPPTTIATFADPVVAMRHPFTCVSDDNLHGTIPIITTSGFSSSGIPSFGLASPPQWPHCLALQTFTYCLPATYNQADYQWRDPSPLLLIASLRGVMRISGA
jgi:hypothetical protein